jgi:hypothetical protein
MAFTMNIQAQLPAAATRARHSASRRASAVVRAEGETSSPKEAATVYFTNRAGQRVTATDEEVRQHSDGGTRAGCLRGRARSSLWCPQPRSDAWLVPSRAAAARLQARRAVCRPNRRERVHRSAAKGVWLPR